MPSVWSGFLALLVLLPCVLLLALVEYRWGSEREDSRRDERRDRRR